MPSRKGQWGGTRRRAGRPRGTGRPAETLRRNRMMISLTDAELARLEQIAEERNLPTSTIAGSAVLPAKWGSQGSSHPQLPRHPLGVPSGAHLGVQAVGFARQESLSSSALASFKSRVSKPSVNQS
jgi:hypothetical protein